jgi:hypothetical protein
MPLHDRVSSIFTSLIQSRYNEIVTRLTQGYNNIVISYMTVSDLLEQTCNKSDNAIKLVTSCLTACS